MVGKAGISLFYTQYQFLKSWWKGALLVFIAWMGVFLIQSILHRRVSKKTSNVVVTVSLIIAIIGMFYSYSDFRNTLSHRWLGERFHLGVYLFWLGWIAITIFVALERKPLHEITQVDVDEEPSKL